MDDKKSQEQNANELPVQGSGAILAKERKKQKKSVEEVAEELNLSPYQIRAIELDQSDGLPGATYVRGYIRSYANLLGLNADTVLNSFLDPNWRQTKRLDDMSWVNTDIDHDRGFNFAKLGSVVSIFLVAATLAWYFGLFDRFLGETAESTVVQVNDSSGNQSTTIASQSEAPSVAVNQSSATVNEQDNSNIDLSIALEDHLDDGAELDTTAEARALNTDEAQLVLNFQQTSWIDIRDKDDVRLAYKTYLAGEELVVSSSGPMSVFIGTAEAVSVILNGEEFDIEPYREAVYAKFIVNDN